jgi:hypothetical protein
MALRSALLALSLFLLSAAADAQVASGEERARELFRKGVELYEHDDIERALDLFMQSRAEWPSSHNVANAAICLKRLQRYDEALEMYEELLTDHQDELSERERAALGPILDDLRKRVASLNVSANVDGLLVVDDKPRGKLPRRGPVRVLPGKRLVRIIKDGYQTYERRVEVELGGVARLDARLVPLAEAGALRVEDSSGEGAQVFVDGAPLGRAPWEGTLGPGKHLVWTRKGESGSAPMAVVVVQGQKAVITARSKPLGPHVTLETRPSSASLWLDDVPLERGGFRGRLPVGTYRLKASEEGYHARTRTVVVPPAGAKPMRVVLELQADREHPRWPKPQAGRGFLGGFVGYGYGTTLNGDAETFCDVCPDHPGVHALIAGLRGGYRFRFGLALELGAGFLGFTSSFDRSLTLSVQPNGVYHLNHEAWIGGPFLAAGVSQRVELGERFGLELRAGAGALFEFAREPLTATAQTSIESLPVDIDDPEGTRTGAAGLVLVDLGADVSFGDLRLGVGFGAAILATAGPTFDERKTHNPHPCSNPEGVGCLGTGAELPSSDVHGPMVLWVPELKLEYVF